MWCRVLVILFVLTAFSKDVNDRCAGLPCLHPTQLLNNKKLRLCQDITEGYSGLCKSGSSSAKACVYSQISHSI